MEADTGYIYKMHPNPRTDGPDNPYFLQAYEQGENGELIPCDALYIGTLEKCRELLDGLNAGTLTQGQVQNIYIHGEAAPVRYYPINEAAARRAQDMNSFYDYKPGSATAEYRAMVDAAYELGEQQKHYRKHKNRNSRFHLVLLPIPRPTGRAYFMPSSPRRRRQYRRVKLKIRPPLFPRE